MEKQMQKQIVANMDVVRSVAKRYLSNGYMEWLDDVVQDVLVKSIERIDKYNSNSGELKAWMARITKNHCLDLMQRFGNDLSRRASVEELRMVNDGFDVNEQHVKRTVVMSGLNQLNDRDRSFLMMKYFFRCSAREISQFTGVPENNIPSYIRRAKQDLRDKIGAYRHGI